MGETDLALLVILFAVAIVAGLVDALAGGGGLLTVPALLAAGFDPATAVATNKLQGVFGTASATATFARGGLIIWRPALPTAALACAGSLLGALAVGLLSGEVLFALMPFLLVAAALYFAFSRDLGEARVRSRGKRCGGRLAFRAGLAPTIGFYDGFFGPGAGSFYLAGLVSLVGGGIVAATAETKLLNLASNLGSLVVFATLGAVAWPVGLAMGAGALLGALLGARLALRKGARLIRPVLVIISVAAALRLFLNEANPLRRWLGAILPG